jgi:hypothetical protein
MSEVRFTGGCQCGAVRYALAERPTGAHLCHCRMCQKAFGNFFADLIEIPKGKFRLTRGSMATFESSAGILRGFCKACGTPLSMDATDEGKFYIAIATLDDCSAFAPEKQFGIESRHSFVPGMLQTPAYATGAEEDGGLEMEDVLPGIAATNRQHPDHDTDEWPPKT